MVLSETCKADAFSEHFQTAENKSSFCFHWVKHIAKGDKKKKGPRIPVQINERAGKTNNMCSYKS